MRGQYIITTTLLRMLICSGLTAAKYSDVFSLFFFVMCGVCLVFCKISYVLVIHVRKHLLCRPRQISLQLLPFPKNILMYGAPETIMSSCSDDIVHSVTPSTYISTILQHCTTLYNTILHQHCIHDTLLHSSFTLYYTML